MSNSCQSLFDSISKNDETCVKLLLTDPSINVNEKNKKSTDILLLFTQHYMVIMKKL